MPQANDRIAVNAAIEKLIQRHDPLEPHAHVVIKFGSTLRKSSMVSVEYCKRASSGDSISGCTPDQGEVTIKDSECQKEKEISIGIHKERIGYFRFWKLAEGVLAFHHFWKSSLTTVSMDEIEPDQYCLGYDPETLDFEYFGMWGQKKIVFRIWLIWWFIFRVQHMEQIYGKVPFKRRFEIELM